MLSFVNYLSEAADSAQNLHMTHADEDIYERGDVGAQASISFIEDFVENIGSGTTRLTVKWDGAPAIFAGHDPEDGKFFVGTKSVFNVNPKVYKTKKDITDNEKGEKASKLIVCLEELSKLGIPKDTVLQGDLLWTTGDHKYETIDGEKWITVHPNTIVYAWPAESDIGKKVRAARLGIIFHTTYKGRGTLQNYRSAFGANISRLKKIRSCWVDDAFFKGSDIAFSSDEYKEVMSSLNQAKRVSTGFDKLVSVLESLPQQAVGAGIKTFINSFIRKGQYPDPKTAYELYIDYVKDYWEQKIISKVKTDAAKDSKRAQLQQYLQEIRNNKSAVVRSFKYVEHITNAKMMVIKKINQLNRDKMFVKTKNGFKVSEHEGYVAINVKKGEAVKFVDRLTFSHQNFSDEYVKGWMK